MSNIGIVGSGIAGLHLGILLRREGLPVTIYADRSADELANGRLLNTVMHHHLTLAREQRLGVDHWDAARDGWQHRYHHTGGPTTLRYDAACPGPNLSVDYRLYLPRLMSDFEDLGGRLVIRPVQIDEVTAVADHHDLLVVATGRGSMQLLFPARADVAAPPGVRRKLCASLVHGVTRPDPEGVTLSFAPGVGELIEFPMVTAQGKATALLLEAIVGGPAEPVTTIDPGEDQRAFEQHLLKVVQDFFPVTYERVDLPGFEIFGPRDTLRGALAPVFRSDVAHLPNGRLAIALGDAHVLVDPLMGQGANIASFSADVLGQAILDDLAFDEQFCRRVAASREPVLRAAYDWTNLALDAPSHLLRVHRAAAGDLAVAADVASRHPRPELMWRVVATEQRVARYLRTFRTASSREPGEDQP